MDDGLRSITVNDGVELPAVCARCGGLTERRTTLQPARQKGDGAPSWIRVLLFLWQPLLLLFVRGRETQRITVRVALCEECEPVVADHVDFEHAQITLLVHRNLYAAVVGPES